MKLIVTHANPDQDALTAIWLVKNYLTSWFDAEVTFVPAGKTYKDEPVDSNDDILHLDTGLGKFDHHQDNTFTCAALKVWQHIKNNFKDKKDSPLDETDIETIDKLVEVVNQVDHFQEVFWPQPDSDRYDFMLERILDGWKLKYPNQNQRFIDWGIDCLDGIYQTLKAKTSAQDEIKKGISFQSQWGKSLACETINDEVIQLAQKKGYKLVLRKDPRKKYLRIKAVPEKNIDLTSLYQKLKQTDPNATWFLHKGKTMLLNGTTKNPDMRPTSLPLDQVIEIIKSLN